MHTKEPWNQQHARRLAPIATLAVAVLACGSEQVPSVPKLPNIVLIISDDQGWDDFGFMSSKGVQTPNLDALAAQGTCFS